MSDARTWPTAEPDCDRLRAYWLARGQFMTGVIQRCIDDGAFDGRPKGDPLWERYTRAVCEMQSSFDHALALATMQKHYPDAADHLAAEMWAAADAGDSYGEWLWQWCEEAGLDPQALYDAGKATA